MTYKQNGKPADGAKEANYAQTMPRRPVSPELLAELTAAVDARARSRQLRRLLSAPSLDGRPARSINQRIAKRATTASGCLRELRAQARILISDAAELRETLAMIGRLRGVFRRNAVARHLAFDNPTGHPDDRDFRADVQRAMKNHGIGLTEAARLIVLTIAPKMSKSERAALLGPWPDSDPKEQTARLRDRLYKHPPRE